MILFRKRPQFLISSQDDLENAVIHYGILPFFSNNIKGFSIEEMCAPGCLFGGNEDYGCWEWKGPVIRRRTTAYGKLFRRKAGFVSLELLPDFINYRRKTMTLRQNSTEEMLLEIIQLNGMMTSTDIRNLVNEDYRSQVSPFDIKDLRIMESEIAKKKISLESPLQKLQMAGRLLISDFKYKKTKNGNRYGWGVALYSTPEDIYGSDIIRCDRSAEESFEKLVSATIKKYPLARKKDLEKLLSAY